MAITRLCRFLNQVAIASCALAVLPAGATTQVLYDSAPGTAPDIQGWLAGGLIGTSAIATSQGTTIDSRSANSAYGGYSNHEAVVSLFPPDVSAGALVNGAFPGLDRTSGYSLTLGFKVISESHIAPPPDRGGFSITLIGSDLKGIAIGFQNDRIFAHNGDATLTAGENTVLPGLVGRAFSSDHNQWNLAVNGDNYTLTQGADTVLSGALRNYGAYTGTGSSAYHTPDFLFFGDNTGSAMASFSVNYAAITTAVPEPSAYATMLAGLALVGSVVWRRRAKRA